MTALALLGFASSTFLSTRGPRALAVALAAVLLLSLLVARALTVVTLLAADPITRGALGLLVAALVFTAVAVVDRRAAGPRAAPPSDGDLFTRGRAFLSGAPLSLVVALLVLALLVELALHAGLLGLALGTTSDAHDLGHRFDPASLAHPLGTDQLGRDVLLRLAHAGRVSLAIAFVAASTSALVGGAVGVLAAERGGLVDEALMRVTDATMALPLLSLMLVVAAVDPARIAERQDALPVVAGALTAIALSAGFVARAIDRRGFARTADTLLLLVVVTLLALALVVGAALLVRAGAVASVGKVALVLVAFGWMSTARVTRAAARPVVRAGFVKASRALGASTWHVLSRHVVPHVAPTLLVAASLEVGAAILGEAALGFLGLGVAPPTPSWGNMLASALDVARQHPLHALLPGALVTVAVACFQVLGDGIRDAIARRARSRA